MFLQRILVIPSGVPQWIPLGAPQGVSCGVFLNIFLISAIIRCFFEVPFALLPWIGIVEFLQGLLPNFVYEILPISAKVFVFFFSETLTTEIPAGHIQEFLLKCLHGFHPQFLNKLVQNLYQRFFLKFFWHFYYSRDF